LVPLSITGRVFTGSDPFFFLGCPGENGVNAKPVRDGLTWGLKIMSEVFIIRAEKAREKAEILKAKAAR
jgi:hypothetical protein